MDFLPAGAMLSPHRLRLKNVYVFELVNQVCSWL
jgi:hypothetical protein